MRYTSMICIYIVYYDVYNLSYLIKQILLAQMKDLYPTHSVQPESSQEEICWGMSL